MAAAVATVGPISIGICVPDSFFDYGHGSVIYTFKSFSCIFIQWVQNYH